MRYFLIVIIFFSYLYDALAAEKQAMNLEENARVVSCKNNAYLYSNKTSTPLKVEQQIQPMDVLKTDSFGRISLMMPNQVLVKIGPKTHFVYRGKKNEIDYAVIDFGQIWLRGKSRNTRFQINTPTVSASIRGTEWYMEVKGDITTVGVMDGTVALENDYGQLNLHPNEVAEVPQGKPPVKSVYLRPKNAVNWTLKYRGLWDEKDQQRGGPELAKLIQNALSAYYRDDLSSAFEILNSAQHRFGETASWLALSGFLKLVSMRADEAAVDFQKALTIDPAWALPEAHLALIALTENNVSEAMRHADNALKCDSSSAVALIAAAYVKKGNLELDTAYDLALTAQKISPNFEEASLTAAEIAIEMDRPKTAEMILARLSAETLHKAEKETLLGYINMAYKHFKTAVEINPDQEDALLGMGISLFNLNQKKEALEAITRATLIAPQVSSLQSYLAKAYYELNRFDDAFQSIARAERLDPKDPTPYLYKSLLLYAKHLPGEAIRSLEKAIELNDNRAVFRSRYLLDQDQAMLISNTSRIYSTLGFDHASTQSAMQSIEMNPSNEGAHRRLYFALMNDPRHYYQAAESELLTAKILVPPTKRSIIFNETYLSPYEETVAKPGIDTILYGQYFQAAPQEMDNKQYTGAIGFSVKPSYPLAIFGLANHMKTSSDIEQITHSMSYSLLNQGIMKTDQDQSTQYYQLFGKWAPSFNSGIFSEVNFTKTGPKSHTLSDQSMYQNDLLLYSSKTQTHSDSQIDMANVDIGGHIDLDQWGRLMTHYSYHEDDSDMDSDTYTDMSTTAIRSRIMDQEHIVQAAFQSDFGDYHAQVGGRFCSGDSRMDSQTQGTGYLVGNTATTESQITSMYAMGNGLIFPKLNCGAGIFFDHVSYEHSKQYSHESDFWNPAIGSSYQLTDNWTFRIAYVENSPADTHERLQPVTLAGFPLLAYQVSDSYTPEQLLNLKHRNLCAGIDYHLGRLPLFWGFEISRFNDKTSWFDPMYLGSRINSHSKGNRWLTYLETMITRHLSGTISYSYGDADHPYSFSEYRYEGMLGYFWENGISLKLKGIVEEKEPNGPLSHFNYRQSTILEPVLKVYLFNNTFSMEITCNYEDRIKKNQDSSEVTEKHSYPKSIRAEMTLFF
ncbi:MAG: TonB-dependent receptor [Desulfobacterales bacterium]|nr:TonB-dependent receptor [Desulfobacterales bacterium]